jgi:primosomal protein N' (replication factor Y) (superfamily II helicase)
MGVEIVANVTEPGERGALAVPAPLQLPGFVETAADAAPQAAPDGELRFAEVALFVPLGRSYSFSIPAALAAGAVTGARVICGLRGRRILGVILAVGEGDAGVARDKLKPILAVVDAEPVVPVELLSFLVELASYYLAPIGEVLRLAVPAVERTRARALKEDGLTPSGMSAVGRSLSYVTAQSPAEQTTLEAQLRGQAREVWEHLRAQQSARLPDLLERWGNARAAVKKLETLGLVVTEQRSEVDGQFFSGAITRDVPPQLNEAQAQAVSAIEQQLATGASAAFLLHGVTASGKTEVYLRSVQAALDRGGSALILVPEIALTPQLVGRFRARLGDTIAVLHSGLSQSQRHAMWTLLYSGARRVAVGARSALFAPLRELRLICVDEEQDHSFKQEEGVRYNARDMALLRAQRAGAVCMLGSATPSIKSFHALTTHKLTRLRLPERAHRAAALPKAEIVDLRRIGPGRPGERLLSLPLCRALEQVLERKEQAILFLNRRGFAPSVVCETCGEILGCPSCEVPLTYHVNPRPHVICHYCDYRDPVPERCAKCQGDTLSFEGIGTERIESALSSAFPMARVGRLDRDTGPGLKSAKVLAQMHAGELDILVGTQMVTKGHDLPRVSLVGVLNADAGLSMPDFQASERTFQLLVQVAGRAGRAGTPGSVLIQTKNPEHPAIALAVTHDVAGFVEQELTERQALGYPPFSRLAMVRVSALDEHVARTAIRELAEIARQRAGSQVEVLGPSPAPIARLRSQYRFRLLVRAKTRAPLRHVLIGIQEARLDRRVRMVVDVDPVSML